MGADGIIAMMVNFNTKDLMATAITTFRAHYPLVPMMVYDNGSQDDSPGWLERYGSEFGLSVVWAGGNKGHGPALHAMMDMARLGGYQYALTLDTDIVVHAGGWIQRMLSAFAVIRGLYAIGWLRWVDRNGVSIPPQVGPDPAKHCPYVHPHCALYDLLLYNTLPPFNNAGAPCADNMWAARTAGYEVRGFPISNYVEHLVAGTRRMYQGRWNPKPGEQPDPWRPDSKIPI